MRTNFRNVSINNKLKLEEEEKEEEKSIYISPKKKSNIKLFVKNSSGKIRIEDQTITPKNNSSNKKSEKMEIENQQITPKKVRYTRSTANQNEPDYVK